MNDLLGNKPIQYLIPGILLAGLLILGFMVLQEFLLALGLGYYYSLCHVATLPVAKASAEKPGRS